MPEHDGTGECFEARDEMMANRETLLARMNLAEHNLRTHMNTGTGNAFYPGQDPATTLRRQAELTAAHIARTNALAAIVTAAAARLNESQPR